jgi:hypothetical protein
MIRSSYQFHRALNGTALARKVPESMTFALPYYARIYNAESTRGAGVSSQAARTLVWRPANGKVDTPGHVA